MSFSGWTATYTVVHSDNGMLKVKVKISQSCPTLWDPMNYTVRGILQARILEWVAFSFSKGSSQPRGRTQVSCIAGGFFTSWATREAQESWSRYPIPSPGDLPNPGIEVGSSAWQADSLPTELSGKPMEYYTVLKRNELSRHELWWKLKCISLSEKRIWKGWISSLWLSGKGKTKDITWSVLTVGLGEVGVNRAHRSSQGQENARDDVKVMDGWEYAQSFNCARLWPRGLQPTRLLCPWDSPGKKTRVGCHSPLQGISPTQGWNPHLCLLYWWLYSF